MIPLHDDNPTELFPLFTIGVMVACVVVWLQVQGAGLSDSELLEAVCTYGAVPADVLGRLAPGERLELGFGASCTPGLLGWRSMVTSMFLHGSWMHLIGNLWFLWIFGNNIEDSMGRFRFLLFYLITGVVAAGAHILSAPDSTVPMVGASGAISGIMGAYLVLYPRARVSTAVILLVFVRVIQLPAWLMLAYWFLIQVGSSMVMGAGEGGGVAFWAHIGGFLAGVVLIRPFARRELVGAKRGGVKLARDRVPHGGWW